MNNRHATADLRTVAGVAPGTEAMGKPDPDGALAALRVGLIALSHEEIDLARSALERAVALDPELPDAHAYLSSALLAGADVDGARGAIARALALDQDGFAPLMKAGELELRLGDPMSAEAHFLGALRAAEPGSKAATAAKAALALARSRVRAGITHHALLPRARVPWPGRIVGRVARLRPRAGTGEG